MRASSVDLKIISGSGYIKYSGYEKTNTQIRSKLVIFKLSSNSGFMYFWTEWKKILVL